MKNNILSWQDNNIISLLANSLKKNKVLATTTDTVYGLLANTTKEGFENLNNTKKRKEKSYIILIDSVKKIPLFVQKNFDEKFVNLINNCWPGPVTLIFKSKINCNDYLKSSFNTIALRIPQHKQLLKLLSHFDGLFSTSANITGEKIPLNIESIDSNIVNSVEFIVIDKNKPNKGFSQIPSTILDCTEEKIKVIREGAYSVIELEKIYGDKFLRS